MKKYAERSEAKKKNRTIKRGPKKLNFGASKPWVRGGPGPLGPPLDPLVSNSVINSEAFLQRIVPVIIFELFRLIFAVPANSTIELSHRRNFRRPVQFCN